MAAPKFLLEPVQSIVSLCREQTGCPIVVGGAGYSIFPQSALEYLGADMGIQGQGERSFGILLERLEREEDLAGIPGLYLPGKGLQGKINFKFNLVFADSLDIGAMRITVGIRIYPYTPLAALAVKDGMVSADDDLLFPRFYIAEDLKMWTIETVKGWIKEHRNWFM